MAEVKSVSVSVGGIDLVFETGKIAKQANGAVYAHYAGSAVIATVCCGEAPSEPIDYVPVSVEYNEKGSRGRRTRRSSYPGSSTAR